MVEVLIEGECWIQNVGKGGFIERLRTWLPWTVFCLPPTEMVHKRIGKRGAGVHRRSSLVLSSNMSQNIWIQAPCRASLYYLISWDCAKSRRPDPGTPERSSQVHEDSPIARNQLHSCGLAVLHLAKCGLFQKVQGWVIRSWTPQTPS